MYAPAPTAPRPHALLLAAGGSTRMGSPKALLRLPDGTPLLLAHLRRYREAGLPVAVCLGAHTSDILAVLPPGVPIWINLRWQRTDMLATALPALRALPGPVLLSPVDAPPPAPETIRALLAATGDAVPICRSTQAPGHPVRLEPPHPALRLDHRLRGAARVVVDDPGCALNLNTPEAWQAWLATLAPRTPQAPPPPARAAR